MKDYGKRAHQGWTMAAAALVLLWGCTIAEESQPTTDDGTKVGDPIEREAPPIADPMKPALLDPAVEEPGVCEALPPVGAYENDWADCIEIESRSTPYRCEPGGELPAEMACFPIWKDWWVEYQHEIHCCSQRHVTPVPVDD
jgi:hypothetical protein